MPDDDLRIADVDRRWYATAFDRLYPIVYAHRTIEAAAPEAAFAAQALALSPRDTVLDLCCGNGRHLVHLQKCGSQLYGLDYSLHLLRIARETLDPRVRLVRGDMRRLPFSPAFDAVANFFTSFGYFQTDAENASVACEMSRVLNSGGRFFMDYLNPPQVEQTLQPETDRESHGYQIIERRWIADGRVNKQTLVLQDGREVSRSGESVQLYEADALKAILARCGLEVERVYGAYDGRPFDSQAPRMLLTGRKAARRG